MNQQARAAGVRFIGNALHVSLNDGGKICLGPDRVGWLSWLAKATPEQRSNWSIEPGGFAIYWKDLDDGIEVRRLLDMEPII